MSLFGFEVVHQHKGARLGRMRTPHGVIETPVFMPVGTQATLKSVLPGDVWDTGTRIMLSNAYHLYLRPGSQVVKEHGGLHKFMNWPGATLTDSGGFQVMSLGHMVSLTDEGARFRSHIDGSLVEFGPQESIKAQVDIGADIIMCFDECPPYPVSEEGAVESARRTLLWAKKAKAMDIPESQALFGIVQGSTFPHLRKQCALELAALDFPGYALGGLAVGEPKKDFYEITNLTTAYLPADKPRYLMGVGHPYDLVEGVLAGVDMFDCVLPSRNARHGRAFTFQGSVNLRNKKHMADHSPIEEGCDCLSCQGFSRSYIRHLFVAGESLAWTLVTVHNLRFFQRLMAEIAAHVENGTAESYKDHIMRIYPVDLADDADEERL